MPVEEVSAEEEVEEEEDATVDGNDEETGGVGVSWTHSDSPVCEFRKYLRPVTEST